MVDPAHSWAVWTHNELISIGALLDFGGCFSIPSRIDSFESRDPIGSSTELGPSEVAIYLVLVIPGSVKGGTQVVDFSLPIIHSNSGVFVSSRLEIFDGSFTNIPHLHKGLKNLKFGFTGR